MSKTVGEWFSECPDQSSKEKGHHAADAWSQPQLSGTDRRTELKAHYRFEDEVAGLASAMSVLI